MLRCSASPHSVLPHGFAAAIMPQAVRWQQCEAPAARPDPGNSDSAGNNFSLHKPSACPVRQCQVSHQRGCAGTSQEEANAFPLLLPWAGFQQTSWGSPSSRERLCQVWAGAGAGRRGSMLSSVCRVFSSTAGNTWGFFDLSVVAKMHLRDFHWKLPVRKPE